MLESSSDVATASSREARRPDSEPRRQTAHPPTARPPLAGHHRPPHRGRVRRPSLRRCDLPLRKETAEHGTSQPRTRGQGRMPPRVSASTAPR